VKNRFLHTEAFRLSAILAAIFALSSAVLITSVLYIVEDQFRDQIIMSAKSDISAIRSAYKLDGPAGAQAIIAKHVATRGVTEFFLLQNKNGTRLAGNLAPMPPTTGNFRVPYPGKGDEHVVLGVGAFVTPDLYVFSGADLYRWGVARRRSLHAIAWILAGALALTAIGGFAVGRRFLGRADAIARACRAIMDGNLKARLPTRHTRDELDRIVENINEMLDRIVALMENLRQVTNDVAHDLRTPLTHLRHQLEWARDNQALTADYEQTLDAAINTADEILALFSALLRIAQIEGGARRSAFTEFDLNQPLRQVLDAYGPVAEDSGHILTANLTQDVIVRGDPELLTQLFSNLLENAIVHTPAGTRVTCTLSASNGSAVVRVSDDGPGVPPEEHAKLFQRLYRREDSRTTPGNGLGLALVAAIADLHAADVAIKGNDSSGLCVQVTLALAPRSPAHPERFEMPARLPASPPNERHSHPVAGVSAPT
jgi:signal transduction histidine kinase